MRTKKPHHVSVSNEDSADAGSKFYMRLCDLIAYFYGFDATYCKK